MISNAKPEDMPSEKPSAAKKKPSSEKTVKNPSDYQSAVVDTLLKARIVQGLTVTIRFVLSVFVRWVQT